MRSRFYHSLTSSLFPRRGSSDALSFINLKIKRQVTSKSVVTCLILCLPLVLRGRCHAMTDEDYNLQTPHFIQTPFAGEDYLLEKSPATTILHFALCILHLPVEAVKIIHISHIVFSCMYGNKSACDICFGSYMIICVLIKAALCCCRMNVSDCDKSHTAAFC